MYGLITQAMERMVCEYHDEDTWNRIKREAGIDVEMFIGMHVYPDEVTFGLFQATSRVLGKTLPEFLESFGRYWLVFTAHTGYDHLLDMAGASLAEFLENLDTLHSVLVEGFPEMKAPTFTYNQVSAIEFDLHYYSERTGLAPMVMGLVKALAKRFGENVAISHLHGAHDGCDHDVLRITLAGDV